MMANAAPPKPEIRCGLDRDEHGLHQSTDGVVDLAWTAGAALAYELAESTPDASGTFEPRYAGPDTSTVRTGLAEGVHRFRVRAIDANGNPGPWSEPLAVEVAYMDRGRVKLLLVLGAVVVVSTIGTILHGHLTHRRPD